MRMLKYVFAVLALVTSLGSGAALAAQQPMPPRVDEFVPISELPPQDQLPAAPLLVSAYVIVLLTFFVYLISLARRMSAIRKDMAQLESTYGRSRRE